MLQLLPRQPWDAVQLQQMVWDGYRAAAPLLRPPTGDSAVRIGLRYLYGPPQVGAGTGAGVGSGQGATGMGLLLMQPQFVVQLQQAVGDGYGKAAPLLGPPAGDSALRTGLGHAHAGVQMVVQVGAKTGTGAGMGAGQDAIGLRSLQMQPWYAVQLQHVAWDGYKAAPPLLRPPSGDSAMRMRLG